MLELTIRLPTLYSIFFVLVFYLVLSSGPISLNIPQSNQVIMQVGERLAATAVSSARGPHPSAGESPRRPLPCSSSTPLRRFRQAPPTSPRRLRLSSPRRRNDDPRASREEIASLVTELDNLPTFRTFDHATGNVVVHEGKAMPNTAATAELLYEKLWTQPSQVSDAEATARELPFPRQLDLALQSHKRHSKTNLRLMSKRQVLLAEASRCRAQTQFEVAIGDMLSHLGKDTEELSLLRVHYSATDELLHRQAQRMAEMELDRFAHHLLSDDVTKVDILTLRLDAFRHNNVPLPPRRIPQ